MALLLMGVARSARDPVYLIGDMVNTATSITIFPSWSRSEWSCRDLRDQGAATYGQSVILSRIANHIIAENQRACSQAPR